MVTKTICLNRLYELERMKGDEVLKSLKRCLSIHCSAGDSEEGEESASKFGQQLMKSNKNPFRYQEDLLIQLR